jgi:hypothetical protein
VVVAETTLNVFVKKFFLYTACLVGKIFDKIASPTCVRASLVKFLFKNSLVRE